MKIVGFKWFCSRSTVGIVQVEDQYDGIKYYIGAPPLIEYAPNTEEADVQWIADWGTTFPKPAGDKLFEVMR
jgi:hypothetical protein